MMKDLYDVIIIGAGPAGLSAGIYAGRADLSVLIIEKGVDGGQITLTSDIENYPGQLLEGEDGYSLTARMAQQCEKFGCEKVMGAVEKVDFSGEVKKVTASGTEYHAKTVIIAGGAYARPIGCEGEDEFRGRGVSYCATCDAGFFRGLDVYVVGGGDAAVEEAMFLTRFARNVTIIHRRDSLRAAKSIQDKAAAISNLHYMWDSVVVKLYGETMLNAMDVKNVKTGEVTRVTAPEGDPSFGLFGFIGRAPETQVYADTGLALDKSGYIIAGEDTVTNLPGVFAAGDIRVKLLRQVVTAAADGAVAATMCDRYINGTIPSYEELRGRK